VPTVEPQPHNLVEGIYLNPQGKFENINHVHEINNTLQSADVSSGPHFHLGIVRPSWQGYKNKAILLVLYKG